MTRIFSKVSGLFGSHKALEGTKASKNEQPIETRAAKAKRSHSVASAFSSKHKPLKSRAVASPKPKSTPAKFPEPDPAAKLKLTPDEYFSIEARLEPKIGPERGSPLAAPARTEAADRMLQENELRNVHSPKMGPVRSEPLEASGWNGATEQMMQEIENRDIDWELEKLIHGLDQEVFAPVDPKIADGLPRPDQQMRAPKTVYSPESMLHWSEQQLEVPAMRDFSSVASETGDAIAKAEAELSNQQVLQSASNDAAEDAYADFQQLLMQHNENAPNIGRILSTDDSGPAGSDAAYREFERMIDPNGPRILPEKHVDPAESKSTGSTDSTEKDRRVLRTGRSIPKPLPKPPANSTKPSGRGR
jgi:hypothetical protein